jgi:hypothetical protein
MNLAELLRAINLLVQNGGTGQQFEALAAKAENLADMVHWADGSIDAQGHWLDRLATLQDDLQLVLDQTKEPAIAVLNDRLTHLGRAIAKHDNDLAVGHTDEDEGEDFS